MSVLEELKKKISDIETQSLAMDGCRPTFTVSEIMDLIDSMESAQEISYSEFPNTSDTISRQAAIDAYGDWYVEEGTEEGFIGTVKQLLEGLPSAQAEQQWIPIKWHDCTDEDREEYGFSDDIVAVFDCDMPNDEQEILVTTTHGHVEKDVCYIDEGFSLDSGYDWVEDIIAWMPLPPSYKGDET